MKRTLVFLILILTSVVGWAANIYVSHAGNDAIVSASGYVLASDANSVTKASAFTNYVWHSGDQFRVVSGSNSIPGYYTIASRTNANTIILTTDPNNCANATCIGGNDGTTETTAAGTLHGPYRTIQFALDNTASGDTIWVKADADYVMNGTDQQASHFIITNPCIIKGYYLIIRDMDRGGLYYKDTAHGWTVIDMNNISDAAFYETAKDGMRWENFKGLNANPAYELIADFGAVNVSVINCWATGGATAFDFGEGNNILVSDCKITGDYGNSYGIIAHETASAYGVLYLVDCYFSPSSGSPCISGWGYGTTVVESSIFYVQSACLAVFDTTGTEHNFIFRNNTVYSPLATLTSAINISTLGSNSIIEENIIVGCSGTSIVIASSAIGANNCFYNNTTNWTLRTGDIVANPQFRNPAAGDFTPMNPVLYDAGGCKYGAVRTQSLKQQNSFGLPFGNSLGNN